MRGGKPIAMENQAIEKAADLLWQARLAGYRLDALPSDCRPRSVGDGYEIQNFMAAHIGRTVLGWKIAATTEAGRRRLGITEPVSGRLFSGFVLGDGERLHAGSMIMRVVEAEFAFRIGRDLPARSAPYKTQELIDAVADLHLAIELPDSRFEHHATMDAASMTADDAFAGWFILGPKIAQWRNLDLPNQAVRVIRNGQIARENHGVNTMGDPCEAFYWLARDRANQGDGLKAGDIVITGTRLTPVEILPGDRVSVEFLKLGEVGAAFD